MVNRRTGTFSMEVKKTVDRGVNTFSISLTSPWCSPESELNLLLGAVCFQRRVLKMHNDYYFTDIKGTPFRWSHDEAVWAVFVSVAASPVDSFPCLCLQCRGCSLQRTRKILFPRKRLRRSWYVILAVKSAALGGGLCGLSRLALLKRYWLVFFRAPWSGTARCRPSRWMVRSGLWKWAFMHYVGYSSVLVGDVGACDVTAALCPDHRTYCNTEEKHEHRHLTQIQAIKLFMTSRRPNLKCENPFTSASIKAGLFGI